MKEWNIVLYLPSLMGLVFLWDTYLYRNLIHRQLNLRNKAQIVDSQQLLLRKNRSKFIE